MRSDMVKHLWAKYPDCSYEDFVAMCLESVVMITDLARKESEHVDLEKAYTFTNNTAQYLMNQMFSA